MILGYNMRHVSTGYTKRNDAHFESEVELLRHLNKWNIEGKGKYLYTAADTSLQRPLAEVEQTP